MTITPLFVYKVAWWLLCRNHCEGFIRLNIFASEKALQQDVEIKRLQDEIDRREDEIASLKGLPTLLEASERLVKALPGFSSALFGVTGRWSERELTEPDIEARRAFDSLKSIIEKKEVIGNVGY